MREGGEGVLGRAMLATGIESRRWGWFIGWVIGAKRTCFLLACLVACVCASLCLRVGVGAWVRVCGREFLIRRCINRSGIKVASRGNKPCILAHCVCVYAWCFVLRGARLLSTDGGAQGGVVGGPLKHGMKSPHPGTAEDRVGLG